jgi:amino acid adenylation domain-containing protein
MSSKTALRHMTPEQFAALRKQSRIGRRQDQDAPPALSFAQQRLWFVAQMQGGSEAYHIPLILRVRGPLAPEALCRALDRLVARHEALRTSFGMTEGEAFQRIGPADAGFALQRHELTERADAESELSDLMREELRTPFDLRQGPLVRGRLVALAAEEHVLVVTMHHIVSDGWSIGVLARELSALYAAYARGGGDPLPALPIQYADFADWQRRWLAGDVAARQGAYWRQALADAPVLLDLPLDRRRPAQQDYRGGHIPLALDADLTAALQALSRRHGMTLFMTVLAGWAVVLSRLSNQRDLVIGAPVANRTRSELDGLIGFFVNTLALRIDLSGAPTADELLDRVAAVALSGQEHQDLPFEQVVEQLNPPRSLAHTPLFQTLFVWQSNDDDRFELPGLTVEAVDPPHVSAKFDLILELAEAGGTIRGSIAYAAALFDAATVRRFGDYLVRALAAMAADPARSVDEIDLLTDAERHRLLREWNDTRRPLADPASLAARVEAVAARDPDRAALVLDGDSLSYRDLNREANRLAHHLIGRGIGPDDIVGLCPDRSFGMIVALLAIMKAGAAYVPLDPALPPARLAIMLADAAPKLVLARSGDPEVLAQGAMPVCRLDVEAESWAGLPEDNPAVAAGDDHLGYVIYTSGSTGVPKGVAQTRRALLNLVDWQIHRAAEGGHAPNRVLQYTALGFDMSFQEIWSTLCGGCTLVLIGEEQRRELGRLRGFIAGQGVRRAFLPTAVLHQMAGLSGDAGMPVPAEGCDIVTAGEALQVGDDLRALLRSLGSARLYNQYGPTETHVVTQHVLDCAEAGQWADAPPIGRPIANTRIYLLDAGLRPVPAGVVGELYIAGAGVARGYINRPDLTAERFLPDPFGEPGGRMYRSGDLARYRTDGTIDYLGRADQQVKIRGFRVEPGEIEAVLRRQDGVREAAVLVREPQPGDRRLVAYVAGAVDQAVLRTALQAELPDHMVPGLWVVLDRLPLTANGKLDRRALPDPEPVEGDAGYEPPRTPVEAQMAAIWARVLKRERVGIRDSFFALGGHSLLATRLLHEINREMSAELSLTSLFRTPVLADLAAGLSRADRGTAFAFETLRPDPAARHRPFPMTDVQQAYWVGREATVSLGGVGAHGYVEMRVRDLDATRFTEALNRLIRRHDMLRAVFLSDGTQQVLESVPRYELTVLDLRGADTAAVEASLGRVRTVLSHQVLDASRWPLFEFRLTLLDGGVTHLHMSTDALIVDAVSSQIIERELMQLYVDPDAMLRPLELTFRDYVMAEQALTQTPRHERALRYWRDRIADLAPAPGLPLARQPESIAMPRFTRRDHALPAEQWERLKAAARQLAVTPSVLLLAAFAEILAVWSRQPRFTINLTLFNRLPLHPGVNAVVGDFTSLVLLEVDAAAGMAFTAKVRAIQARLWQDIDHSAVSGVRVIRELSQIRGSQQSAMPVVFNSTLTDASIGLDDFSLSEALGAERVFSITQTPQVWLDHTLWEAEGRLCFNWDSIDELFPDGMIAEMFSAYCALLERLGDPAAWGATTPDLVPLTRLAPPPEDPAPAASGLMHELFDRQALLTPGAPAVLGGDRDFSYGALREAARRLGGRLQARGVAPNRLVAVAMERGWQQVVATLGILYAGGAYLPIDPSLPAERIAHILERAQADLVLTQSALLNRLPLSPSVAPVAVEAELDAAGAMPLQPVALAESDLAYVIYTSGSAGLPKGVMIDHRGAVNTLLDINERFAVGPADRVLAISSLSFDLSVFDFFGALAAGAAVVLLAPELARDPEHWLDRMAAHRVSLWNSVPALLGMLVEYAEGTGQPLPGSLRLAMLSGDWIPLALPGRVRALRPGLQLASLGGATEASIWSIWFPIGEIQPGWRSIPYGKALKHQRFHVLDDHLQQRPAWVPGQLYIGGIGLAQGYWRDEALTAASFIRHPLTGERLYRTGDLGRLLPDGNIEFLGREDGQVKVQGYRIELGEIEAALDGHPAVQANVVRLLGDAQGEKRLAAYVVLARPDGEVIDGEAIDGPALARYLTMKLPPYMVPGSFTFLEAFPLSANGKVDRGRLPEPTAGAASGPDVELRGPEEEKIAEIVRRVLKREAIATSANLLNLGATSIDIVRIGNALAAELSFRPRLALVLIRPTLADLIGLYREQAGQEAIAETAKRMAEAGAAQRAIDDPEARKSFKEAQRGRRIFAGARAATALRRPADPAFDRRFAEHRSVRRFAGRPVAAEAFAALLACLSRGVRDGRPKYLYPSAGGLYPVQTYAYAKPGRIQGVAGGAYYHDPFEHRLVAVGQGRSLPAEAYDPFVNQPVFAAAAFALFFVAEMAAIQPLYGERSLEFCHIEAGAMAQLLTGAAIDLELGLCGIGAVETDAVAPLLELGPTHRLVFSMLGGLRAEGATRQNRQMEAFAAGHVAPAAEMEEFEL